MRARLPEEGGRVGPGWIGLRYADGGAERLTSEAWVDVPRGAELELAGLRPNPTSGDLVVAFSLPRAGSAGLQLLDLSGRERVSRDLSGVGAGFHPVRLASAGDVAPGVHWLRLRHEEGTRVSRAVVVR